MPPKNIRKWVIFIPILVGLAILVLLAKGKPTPEQTEATETPKPVRIVSLPRVDVIPRTKGYGVVQPGTNWEAVAQIKGTVVEKHPRLEKGNLLDKGVVILRIDPSDYELAITEIEADIQAAEAQLAELDAKDANTRALISLEQKALALSEKELVRKRKLAGQGSVSRSDLEQEENNLLARKQSLQAQRNALSLLPAQKRSLEAQLNRHQTRLKGARRDLDQTVIRMPFRGRISEVNIEKDQYVREGELLASADDIRLAEIEVQLPANRLRDLVLSDKTLDAENGNLENLAGKLGILAQVRLKQGAMDITWDAEFARLSDTLDPQTRTVGVIVEVPGPYANVKPGQRPPLVKGLYVEVILSGRPRPARQIVPRHALHDGRLYLVNTENRLEIRPVKTEMILADYAVLSDELEDGLSLVVSSLLPAIEGMLLQPLEDEASLKQLISTASGGN